MLENFLVYGTLVNFFLATFLKIRQYRVLGSPQSKVAMSLQTPEEHRKSVSYSKDKMFMAIVETSIMCIKEVVLIKYRIYPIAYKKYFEKIMYSDIMFYMFFTHLDRLIEVPFALISAFYNEAKHEFNKMTLETFIIDFIKTSLLVSCLIPLVLSISGKIICKWSSFYLYLWAFMTVFQILMIVIYPTYIQPLFNKFEELADGELKSNIEKLATRVGFKANKIFLMDGSKRSGHSNAYFIGLTSEKRIVLYDTLIEQMNEKEILAVLCHEFGHWKYGHTYKMISTSLLMQLGYMYAFNYTINSEYMKNTLFYEVDSLVIKFIYFIMMVSISNLPLTFLSNAYSRMNEREADRYAVSLGYGADLREALIKLHRENKSPLFIDPLYSAITHSHPTLLERLSLINSEINKQK